MELKYFFHIYNQTKKPQPPKKNKKNPKQTNKQTNKKNPKKLFLLCIKVSLNLQVTIKKKIMYSGDFIYIEFFTRIIRI